VTAAQVAVRAVTTQVARLEAAERVVARLEAAQVAVRAVTTQVARLEAAERMVARQEFVQRMAALREAAKCR
jgi:hypothetical protein